MYKDGSQAWDAKDFLIQQEECGEVSIEGKTYYGKNNPLVSFFWSLVAILMHLLYSVSC